MFCYVVHLFTYLALLWIDYGLWVLNYLACLMQEGTMACLIEIKECVVAWSGMSNI
jgi:hypothetical protein